RRREELKESQVVIVTGYAIDGSLRYADRLSIRHAESVKAYLVSLGFDGNKIYTEGKGPREAIRRVAQFFCNARISDDVD
ncbi:OmpA family protein, partial [Cupriavidus basilensis]